MSAPSWLAALHNRWTQDECAPDAETVEDAWVRIFGEWLDKRASIETFDGGDTFVYLMPNGHAWGQDFMGGFIMSPENEFTVSDEVEVSRRSDGALVMRGRVDQFVRVWPGDTGKVGETTYRITTLEYTGSTTTRTKAEIVVLPLQLEV